MKPITVFAGLLGLGAAFAARRQRGCRKYAEARDPKTNRENKQTAVEKVNYGPDPFGRSGRPLGIEVGGVTHPAGFDGYWRAKAARFGISLGEASTQLCGNCSAFDVSHNADACGVATKENLYVPCEDGGFVRTASRGYCMAWRFQCSALRTCDSWSVGGPHRK